MAVDGSSYSLQTPSSSSAQNAQSLLLNAKRLKQNQQNPNAGSAYPTAPTQDSSYGSGTDMSLLGAGQPYGGSK